MVCSGCKVVQRRLVRFELLFLNGEVILIALVDETDVVLHQLAPLFSVRSVVLSHRQTKPKLLGTGLLRDYCTYEQVKIYCVTISRRSGD